MDPKQPKAPGTARAFSAAPAQRPSSRFTPGLVATQAGDAVYSLSLLGRARPHFGISHLKETLR